ncbi:MAG: succinate dehydrogenase, cytochrome b556 subunit [Gammaproteobacteria bacterium]|nr:succinate dehydrogenase, cytochrome b556 subunit [Gammaproteobacteria bacterium]MDD9894647.1 succinate dehydrogenase, cytochrome b556 subunit [Gammaproteobacteria bacterium]MDD9960094.1 succinate dehydrogenase, cytochrome b556 subunit [Gammaproteobacteria bacterium]
MKDNRPVNLDITTIKFPLAAIASILHRISGIGLFFGLGILLYFLQMSLASETEFNRLVTLLENNLIKILLWLLLAAVLYHLIAGIKHLLLDLGIGESKQGAKSGAAIMLALFVVTAVAGGIWIW